MTQKEAARLVAASLQTIDTQQFNQIRGWRTATTMEGFVNIICQWHKMHRQGYKFELNPVKTIMLEMDTLVGKELVMTPKQAAETAVAEAMVHGPYADIPSVFRAVGPDVFAREILYHFVGGQFVKMDTTSDFSIVFRNFLKLMCEPC